MKNVHKMINLLTHWGIQMGKKIVIDPEIKEKSRITKEEWRDFTLTVWQIANVKNPDHPAVFPDEIPHRLIKMYSFIEETVLDPFAGTGTTGKIALNLNRKAICVEQNKNYVDILKSEMKSEVLNKDISIKMADSRRLSFIEDETIGLIVTSPPYWDKADYGTKKMNLGNIHSYTQFIKDIKPVFEECYRVLMPGRKLCIITANVNQHTENGLLTFPIAADFTVLLRNLGFLMVNEVIWNKNGTGGKWGSYGHQRPIFGSYPFPPNLLFKNVHEYILIFMKPPSKKTTGKTVKSYSELMEDGLWEEKNAI